MSEPVVPVKTYVMVFVALLVLAAVTTAVAYVDLGIFNTIVAMAIATAKMILVLLFFMHVRYKPGLTRFVIFASFFWLALLVSMTLIDVYTRAWTPQPSGWGVAGL